ncbi:hypothetical protein IG631_02061 [Alternaria alternata]|nr:hypothetical protein IG631_02061 [Alternaria alternata]
MPIHDIYRLQLFVYHSRSYRQTEYFNLLGRRKTIFTGGYDAAMGRWKPALITSETRYGAA